MNKKNLYDILVHAWDTAQLMGESTGLVCVQLKVLQLGLPGPVTQILKSGGKYACVHAGVHIPQ